MKRILLFMIVVLQAFASVMAEVYTVDDINYTITSEDEKTVSVTVGTTYVGDVVVPSAVVINGNTYVVTATDNYAFNQCTDLVTVTLPSTLKSLGMYTFNGCTSLEDVNIPDGITTIPFGCFYLTGLKKVTLPSTVTTIDKYAFAYSAGLAEINITDAITYIGEAAFCGTGLKTVTIPSSITEIEKYAFTICQKLESVTLHNRITTIGDNAFAADLSLKSIKIPESVTSIGASAFATCQALEEIEIPDGVASIPAKCFYSCTGLKKAVFGTGVKSIGEDAFTKYKSITESFQLKTLVLKSNTMVTGGANFDKILYFKTTVYVPEQLVDTYKADTYWGNFNIAKIDTSTGVTGVTIEPTAAGHWYNLDGTRAVNHTNGVFIHNGKTVVIK